MAQKRVTMQQIADACGVSRMTVSLAMKGDRSRVSKANINRILKTAEKMGYVQDAQLSKLTTYLADQRRGVQTKGELAFLITLMDDSIDMGRHYDFLEMIREPARKLGYRVEAYECGESASEGMSVKQIERIWDTRGVQGAFIAPISRGRPPPPMTWEKYSWIACGDTVFEPNLHRVDTDFRYAVIECFEQLEKLGYQRIGLIITKGFDEIMQFAISSAADSFFRMNRDIIQIPIMDADVDVHEEKGRTTLRRWIDQNQPDAIIASGVVYNALLGMGYRFPEDFAYANWRVSHPSADGVSGTIRESETIGRTCAELLISQIQNGAKGPLPSPVRTRINGRWHQGKTSPKVG